MYLSRPVIRVVARALPAAAGVASFERTDGDEVVGAGFAVAGKVAHDPRPQVGSGGLRALSLGLVAIFAALSVACSLFPSKEFSAWAFADVEFIAGEQGWDYPDCVPLDDGSPFHLHCTMTRGTQTATVTIRQFAKPFVPQVASGQIGKVHGSTIVTVVVLDADPQRAGPDEDAARAILAGFLTPTWIIR